jgi:hypothetical protein
MTEDDRKRLRSFKGYVEESYLVEMANAGVLNESDTWPIAGRVVKAVAKGAGKAIKGTVKGLYKGSAWAAKKAIAKVKQKRAEVKQKEHRKSAAAKMAALRQKSGKVVSAPAKAVGAAKEKRKKKESYDQYAKERAAKLGKTPEKQDHVEKTKQRMKEPDSTKYQHPVTTPTGPGIPKAGKSGIETPSRKRFYNR